MAIKTTKYNCNLQAGLSIDDGQNTYIGQTKYSYATKIDYVQQISLDLLANVETTLNLPGLVNLRIIQWDSNDPVSLAFQFDTQIIPSPVFNTPSCYGVLKFQETLPLFVPTFIKLKSLLETSVEVVIVGNKV